MNINEIIYQLLDLPENKRVIDSLKNIKRIFARKYHQTQLISNMQLLHAYKLLVTQKKIPVNDKLEILFRKRSIRSQSGIVPIQVLTMPYPCPGNCIFCPNQKDMPKSYLNSEPGAMRAKLNDFDPIKQVYNRLTSLEMAGHNIEKIEMIILGGTRDYYPEEYKINFMKSLYNACNTYQIFKRNQVFDFSSQRIISTSNLQNEGIIYASSLLEAQNINETAIHKIIGLTIETRPDYVNMTNCASWRSLGVTRVELGVQTIDNKVLQANNRQHSAQQIESAIDLLRKWGFKICIHLMPGLYKSNLTKDLNIFKQVYKNFKLKPDELKIYPISVLPGTDLEKLYIKGEYIPYSSLDLINLITDIKLKIIPPYTRIKRLIRDIPAPEIIAGSNITNLRQLINNKLNTNLLGNKKLYRRLYLHVQYFITQQDILIYLQKNLLKNIFLKNGDYETLIIGDKINITSKRNFNCLCTRCREIAHYPGTTDNQIYLIIRRYLTHAGEELFISHENKYGYLLGFLRLLLINENQGLDVPGLGLNTAIIRELHIYGGALKINQKNKSIHGQKVQHLGLGKELLKLAENISIVRGYQKISVISGIGVRGYYQKNGYYQEGTYLIKKL